MRNQKCRKEFRQTTAILSSEKENITLMNNELNTVNAAIIEQNSQLASMEEGPAKKEKAEQIKELEKRKKKALNSIKSSENKINKSDSDINNATGDIPRNETMQETVKGTDFSAGSCLPEVCR